ncbi:TPA: helix-turn-helix domain-containing protein [Streptococcus suis]|uniref:XRE family transcriptional regulator n=1 Tax=Streptococcus suis 6407 TaxID=1214179 RepID=A0A075SEU7_STRSU|nr:helix-turn-helix transcriptional regulator [Streptococcus suis]AIG43877.1 XRE family transcriptional regulator [Streptococcus suis 6407]MBS0737561.1 helix-turn-helix transcriptional regulator [Streptococcus suis]MBS0739478.1 helix-turn-helix transcriptional regulator [Streptococcus suis]MBS0741395.1 helix-turn-helix transcriptional regulator [Streptococcus suis]MBS0747203.1 helix-turn-helix transcriptional regulator [Streptococcus suis]
MFSTFERIKELAKSRGVTLGGLEERLGLSRNSIYTMKNKKPSAERLQLIADYFNVSTDYLLGRTDNPRVAKTDDEIDKIDFKELAAESMSYDGKPFDEDDIEFFSYIMEQHFKNKYKE